MKRWLLSFISPLVLIAQAAPNTALAPDSATLIGKLNNGLSYYIKQNAEPVKRAELRLVINVGSNQEDDDQKGLAHFVEHMLFKGTQRFPGLGVIDFLETTGMQFGPDINASTSFDETIYMLKIPTDKPEVIQKSFDVLEDWASRANLDATDIKAEGPVIVEEERLRDKTAGGRINKQVLDTLTRGSRYAERRPIGDLKIIQSVPEGPLKRFYQDWYRPDLMAVVAVGDFDPKAIEAIIRQNFSKLTGPSAPRPRTNYTIPARSADIAKVVEDKEFPATVVQLSTIQTQSSNNTEADFDQDLLNSLFSNMLNTRLRDLTKTTDSPLLSADAELGEFLRGSSLQALSGQAKEGKDLQALELLVTELRRVRLGFLQSELDRAKADLKTSLEQTYNERNKRDSGQLVDAYVDAFLNGGVVISAEDRFQMGSAFVQRVTLQQVNQFASTFMKTSKDYMVIRPEKEGLAKLSSEQVLASVRNFVKQNVEAYREEDRKIVLFDEPLAPSAIGSEVVHQQYSEFTLANGVRVLHKKTDFKDDQVVFSAYSPGGASLYSDADYPSAIFIANVVNQSGVKDFTSTELEKSLAGKNANAIPNISERSEGFSGSAKIADLETSFQLINLYFTSAKAEQGIFDKEKSSLLEAIQNRSLSPTSGLVDAIEEFAAPGSNRAKGVMTLEQAQSLSLERGMEIYGERFANAADFTFVFVGNYDEAVLKDLASRYLGNLPSSTEREQWANVFPAAKSTAEETNIYAGLEQRSYAVYYSDQPLEYNLQNAVRLQAIEKVLDLRTTEELREKQSGIYGASVSSEFSTQPQDRASVFIFFTADPNRSVALLGSTVGLIDEIKKTGVSEINMAKVKEQLLRSREEAIRTNQFWLGRIVFSLQEPRLNPDDITGYDEAVKSLTSQMLSETANQIFSDVYLKAFLFPADMKPKP